jgi:sigma-E factor negative regulatory protein RseA
MKGNFMSGTGTKKPLEESLSALVDGEISELELHRLLKASDEDYEQLRDQWTHAHLARAAIKQDFPAVDMRDLSGSIRASINEEATCSVGAEGSSEKRTKQSVWFGVGRFAIAASVASIVVFSVQFSSNDVDHQVADLDIAPMPPVSIPAGFGHGLLTETTVSTVSNESSINSVSQKPMLILNESTQKQLQQAEQQVGRFMLEHAQNAAQNTQQGVLPYVRVPETWSEQ